MILYKFREHLAAELTGFPVEPNAVIGSYAVTTAALARKILQYVNAKDLVLQNGLEPEEAPYKLITVLNRIVHFRLFGQDAISFDYPDKPDLVTLYSDKTPRYGDHMYIRLSDYWDMINQLANDDLFVGKYLLRRTITKLSQVANSTKPIARQDEFRLPNYRKEAYGFMRNAWYICLDLWHSGKVKVPSCDVEWYEDLFQRGGRKHYRLSTCQELIDGYLKSWHWASSNPDSVEIEGIDTYCMCVDEVRPGKNGNYRCLLIPFKSFIQILVTVRREIEASQAE